LEFGQRGRSDVPLILKGGRVRDREGSASGKLHLLSIILVLEPLAEERRGVVRGV